MTPLDGVLAAIALMAASGASGLAFGRRSAAGEVIATGAMIAGASLGALLALAVSFQWTTSTRTLPGPLPELSLHLRLDPLAAFFLAPVCVLGAAGALYGLRYWGQAEHPDDARWLRLWFGVLVASLGGVVLAADGLSFLVAWEIMALSAFLLVTTEDEHAEVREAGWLYLVATHAATLALFALFGGLWAITGSLAFLALPDGVAPGVTGVLFLLALLAFGLKAGIAPLHFWLPGAHANAPSHVSALLSGVVLKMGIYGLLRILTLLPAPPPGVGMLLLGVGAASAIYGVLFALGQHDLKRLLAYHSVENIGIIVMGLGLALVGVGARQPVWAALGLAGCLLHVWNHALFKSLLFLAAGSVIHAAGTREIERLGGLAQGMARTSSLFAIGAIAICGLPPLNGFVSELLIYVGLLRIGADGASDVWAVAPLAVPLLAMAGALAIACFVKAFGTVFLGPSRSEAAAHAHESPRAMQLAMLVPALGCIAIGAFPALVVPALDGVVAAWVRLDPPPPPLADLVPWGALMAGNAALVVAAALAALVVRSRARRAVQARSVTWDCGYARPSARMAYTPSSFAQILVGIHGWLLRPRTENGVADALFPGAMRFHTRIPEQVIEGVLLPLWGGFRRSVLPLRAVQHGRIQQYLAYVLLTLCVLVASLFPIGDILARFLRW